ncbi:MAG: DUF2070 family protein [Candidatus Freyrarchaeum guaymaensis]
MWSFLLKFYKLYNVPCRYPIGYPLIAGEVVFLHFFLSGLFGLSFMDRSLLTWLYPFQTFFLLMIGIDVALWVFLLPGNSVVFPELSRKQRVNLFSFLTAISLLMVLTLVYPPLWSLTLHYLALKLFYTHFFSTLLIVLQYPLVVVGLYPVLNELVFHSLRFFLDYGVTVNRIYWVIGFRYVYLLSATERASRIKYLRILLAIPPTVFLTGVFQLTSSPLDYVVASTLYCVVTPAIIVEAVVLGTSTIFPQDDKKIRVSAFDIFRRSITFDVLGEGPQTENLGLTDFNEEVNIWSGVVAFKTEGMRESLLVVPSLHPGPFLFFCGSLLSYKISKALKDNYNPVMVLHSPSTHDFNPATASEIPKIVNSVRRSLRNGTLESYDVASPLVVEEKRNPKNHIRVSCQAFGEGENQTVLIFCDVKKGNNEDISYGVGNHLIEAAKRVGAKDAIIIDKHITPHPVETPLFVEDSTTLELRKLVERAVRRALKARKERPLFAGAKMTREEIEALYPKLGKEIGKDGITLYVLRLEDTDKKIAYILLDANTVEPELEEKILKLFKKNGFKERNILIMTSDTHQYPHFLRPLGSKKEIQEPIIAALRHLLQKVSEPRRATISVGRVESRVNVWGFPNGERFLTLLLKSFPVVLAAFLIQWMVGFLSYMLPL